MSAVEAKSYPVYGTQFHPEKNNFEWVKEDEPIPHSIDAVRMSQYFANFFVQEARKSTASLSDDKYNEESIWNTVPTFTGKSGGYFMQTYFF